MGELKVLAISISKCVGWPLEPNLRLMTRIPAMSVLAFGTLLRVPCSRLSVARLLLPTKTTNAPFDAALGWPRQLATFKWMQLTWPFCLIYIIHLIYGKHSHAIRSCIHSSEWPRFASPLGSNDETTRKQPKHDAKKDKTIADKKQGRRSHTFQQQLAKTNYSALQVLNSTLDKRNQVQSKWRG